MKQINNLLSAAAQKLDLPADIVAGQPRLELIGSAQCSIEPHKGLVEYTKELVSVDTSVGIVNITGRLLDIAQMNRERITVRGRIFGVSLEEIRDE
jgi:sporulation protein YqfC